MILDGSDHDLAIQAQNGSKEVLEILFSRYRAPIYHLALTSRSKNTLSFHVLLICRNGRSPEQTIPGRTLC